MCVANAVALHMCATEFLYGYSRTAQMTRLGNNSDEMRVCACVCVCVCVSHQERERDLRNFSLNCYQSFLQKKKNFAEHEKSTKIGIFPHQLQFIFQIYVKQEKTFAKFIVIFEYINISLKD